MTLGVLIANRAAHAQNANADALFAQGDKLMQQGKLAEACEAFAASNRMEPTAGTLIQLGKCLSRSHRFSSAWSAYKDALARVKDVKKRKTASDAVAGIEPRLSYLLISVSDEGQPDELTITRDGRPIDRESWNQALPVDGDDYFIIARAPGYQTWQTTVRVAEERDRVVVEIPHLEPLPRPAEAPAMPAVAAPAPSLRIPELTELPSGDSLSMTRKLAIGLGGTSVAALATAAVLGTLAQGRHADASRLCPAAGEPCARSLEANALVRAGNRWTFHANLAWGLAGAAAIASGVLWLVGAPAEPTRARISIAPAVASGELGVVVIGRSSW